MKPLEEVQASFDDLEVDLQFVADATRIRPRLGDVVRWEAGGEVVQLAQGFMDNKASRPEAIYASLLVRSLGVVERFFRKTLETAVTAKSKGIAGVEQLSELITARNIRLTGRILATFDEPRDHLKLDIAAMVENLASCKPGNSNFRLNAQAFAAILTGAGPATLEKALSNVDIGDCWDAVGRNQDLATILGTKGARATGSRARERLKELWKLRNQVAHGADDEITISEAQLRDGLAFLRAFTKSLEAAVSARPSAKAST